MREEKTNDLGKLVEDRKNIINEVASWLAMSFDERIAYTSSFYDGDINGTLVDILNSNRNDQEEKLIDFIRDFMGDIFKEMTRELFISYGSSLHESIGKYLEDKKAMEDLRRK